MNRDEFLYNLHFDVAKVRQNDVPVDWDNAPLTYKVYQGVSPIALPDPKRGQFGSESGQIRLDLSRLGALLKYTYGLTQVAHVASPWQDHDADATQRMKQDNSFVRVLRRFVPSGGGLYPSEVYVYVRDGDIATGIYHYDVAHHALRLLREGNFDSYLGAALGHREGMTEAVGVVFVSTVFWKNFFKYRDFSYRLQAIDAGAVVGQVLALQRQVQLTPRVYLEFLDQALNHLLGLEDEIESVYAVVALTPTSFDDEESSGMGESGGGDSSAQLCSRVPSLRSNSNFQEKKLELANVIAMNQASMRLRWPAAADPALCKEAATPLKSLQTGLEKGDIQLPETAQWEYDVVAACRERYSPGTDFSYEPLSLMTLATLLKSSVAELTTPVPSSQHDHLNLTLAVTVHGVEGVPDGAYLYNHQRHVLCLQRSGDYRQILQEGMSMPNVNLSRVPLCLHIVGERYQRGGPMDYRGYRMQQLRVGMVMQRLLLVATSLGLGGHPLLDYDEDLCDDIYNLWRTHRTCFIQIPIGSYKTQYRFSLPI